MNAKTAKKIRQWSRRRWRKDFKEYVRTMQEQPLKERLYFAWYVVAKRGMK